MASALEELERLNPTFWTRVSVWIVAFTGVALVVDMAVRLGAGEGYHLIRHTIGFLAIAWVSFLYSRMVRRAVVLLARASVELVDRFAPADWSTETRLAFAADLPYERLARTFALFGTGALSRALRKALAARLSQR